jgi:hypothetical protein
VEGNSRWRPALPVMFAGPPPADRGSIPPASHGSRRCPCHRWVLRRPNSDAPSKHERLDPSDPAGRNADRESSTGAPGGHPGGCKRALERTVLLKGGLQPPPLGRRDHEAPRPQDGTGSTRSANCFVRPVTSAGSRTRRTRGGVRSRARPDRRLATIHAAKGGTGRPPGGCKRALERTFFSRAACSPPSAVQGSKPFLNGLAPRSPATRARISSKAADPAESQGKAADWRCIHAHFPVKNQVIP